MTTIFCDDVFCKIEIVPNTMMFGTFYVVLDGDDESAQCALDYNEACDIAEDMYAEFVEDNGQFGVGA